MREHTINVYKFNELSDTAKERALSDYCNHSCYAWDNEVMEVP